MFIATRKKRCKGCKGGKITRKTASKLITKTIANMLILVVLFALASALPVDSERVLANYELQAQTQRPDWAYERSTAIWGSLATISNLDMLISRTFSWMEGFEDTTVNIVRGRVIGREHDRPVNSIRVLETFVGSAERGDIFYNINRVGNPFLVGDHVILVMWVYEDNYFTFFHHGAFFVPPEIPMSQSILETAANGRLPLDTEFPAIYPFNDFTFTVNDLLLIIDGEIPRTSFLLSFNLMDDEASPAVPPYIEPILVPFRENVLQYLAANRPEFPMDNPTRPGYDFVGWYMMSNPSWHWRISSGSLMSMMDTTWYARWAPSHPRSFFTVTFDMRSDEISPVTPAYIEPILVREGWPLLSYLLANHPTFAEEPTRERELFLGWRLDADDDRLSSQNRGSLLQEDYVMPSHDVALFAGWSSDVGFFLE